MMIEQIEKRKINGKNLCCYRLENNNGMKVEIINYGARIHKLIIPDINGVERDVVIGFNDIGEYIGSAVYFNAVIGRTANRIGGAEFVLNEKKYFLYQNDGKNSLHGGKVGFDSVFWDGSTENDELVFTYFSKDMEYLEFLNQLLTLLMRNLLFLLFSDHQGKTEYFRFP